MISLDYHSSSIGLDFGIAASGIKKIVLTQDPAHRVHRLGSITLNLYLSVDNLLYTPVPKEDWEFTKDDKGVITLTLKERIATRYLKLHVLFDDRDQDFAPVDKATFLNELAGMLKVYQEADARTEEYGYDEEGNRSYVKLQLIRTFQYQQEYYPNSNRLKSDGIYQYAYDANGNLISKEKVERDPYEPEEKWAYTYDLLNRLIKVEKNGILVAEYGYDPDGFRVVKKARGETIHYVFEGTEPILEKRITVESNVKIRSYIYALGKHLARVDGVIGDPEAPVYFYHTDHLGSVRVVTDLAGKVVWNADYFVFGTQYGENSSDFEEGHGFTGKEYDPDTGLYYFNARWYDSKLGRFISEDQMGDPNNPNLYVYGRNNPLRFFDPTGLFTEEGKVELDIDINIDVNVNIPEIQLDKEINLDTTPVTAGKYGVVTEGDMLWDIAEREYGDPNLYPILQKVNNIEDPTQLQLGQKLYIPDINQISFTSKDGTTITSYSYVTFDPDTLLKGIRDKSVINKNVAIKGQEANLVQEFHEGKGYKNDYSVLITPLVRQLKIKEISICCGDT